jgi:hypothetical protein
MTLIVYNYESDVRYLNNLKKGEWFFTEGDSGRTLYQVTEPDASPETVNVHKVIYGSPSCLMKNTRVVLVDVEITVKRYGTNADPSDFIPLRN